jgi:hypothetical protein
LAVELTSTAIGSHVWISPRVIRPANFFPMPIIAPLLPTAKTKCIE